MEVKLAIVFTDFLGAKATLQVVQDTNLLANRQKKLHISNKLQQVTSD